jgi:hypothetical protein
VTRRAPPEDANAALPGGVFFWRTARRFREQAAVAQAGTVRHDSAEIPLSGKHRYRLEDGKSWSVYPIGRHDAAQVGFYSTERMLSWRILPVACRKRLGALDRHQGGSRAVAQWRFAHQFPGFSGRRYYTLRPQARGIYRHSGAMNERRF